MNEWPASLPLPYCDFGGGPRNATIVGAVENGHLARRSRFQKAYTNLEVDWRLRNRTLVAAFETFYETTLGMGVGRFTMDLRYPKNSDLTNWVVQFAGDYRIDHGDGVHFINATLDLLRPTALAAAAPILSFTGFMVENDESSGAAYISFVTSEGNDYHVRE